MKKIVFVLMSIIAMTGCSVENDSPRIQYELAEITDSNLPEEFNLGQTYEISVNYQLPSECSAFSGLDARRAGTTSDDRRNIYVAAVSQVVENNTCDETIPGSNGSSKFSLFIDEDEDYTFNFWIGEDTDGEPEYFVVTVPVAGPGDNT